MMSGIGVSGAGAEFFAERAFAAPAPEAASPQEAAFEAGSVVGRALWMSAWQAYRHAFIDGQGRVIDYSADSGFTTSEGQAYGLFFSLVAGDKPLFQRILAWTSDNLAEGRLGAKLPAWKWGREQNYWGIIGRNSASDADSWMAYALLEAGRIWKDHDLGSLGHRLAARIVDAESVIVDQVGRVLIPGSTEFPVDVPVLVNPSYAPLFLLHGIAGTTGNADWRAILAAQPKLIETVSDHGFAPNWSWLPFRPQTPPPRMPDTGTGSFDAIRCYLWAGLTAADTPEAAYNLSLLHGMADYLDTHQTPPQSVDIRTGAAQGSGSIGFSGALLPYLLRLRKTKSVQGQLLRVMGARQPDGLFGKPAEYYATNLILFGLGGLTGAIRFAGDGRLASS